MDSDLRKSILHPRSVGHPLQNGAFPSNGERRLRLTDQGKWFMRKWFHICHRVKHNSWTRGSSKRTSIKVVSADRQCQKSLFRPRASNLPRSGYIRVLWISEWYQVKAWLLPTVSPTQLSYWVQHRKIHSSWLLRPSSAQNSCISCDFRQTGSENCDWLKQRSCPCERPFFSTMVSSTIHPLVAGSKDERIVVVSADKIHRKRPFHAL